MHATHILWRAAGQPHYPADTPGLCRVCGEQSRGVAIAGLLSDVTHIGKKAAQGYGRVIAWTVEPWPEQWWLRDGRGKLMRAMPEPGGVLYGVRPSYWEPRHQTECRLPDA